MPVTWSNQLRISPPARLRQESLAELYYMALGPIIYRGSLGSAIPYWDSVLTWIGQEVSTFLFSCGVLNVLKSPLVAPISCMVDHAPASLIKSSMCGLFVTRSQGLLDLRNFKGILEDNSYIVCLIHRFVNHRSFFLGFICTRFDRRISIRSYLLQRSAQSNDLPILQY